MKNATLACFLLSVSLFGHVSSRAQAPDTSTIDGLYSYIFAPLDKTQISTGYLEEYGVPILTLAPYNGTLSSNNKIDMTTWRLLYCSGKAG